MRKLSQWRISALLYQRHLLSSFLAKSQESGLSSILTCQACHPGYAAETFWSKYFQKCLATLQAWPPLRGDGLFSHVWLRSRWSLDHRCSWLLLFAFQDRLQALFSSHGSNWVEEGKQIEYWANWKDMACFLFNSPWIAQFNIIETYEIQSLQIV